MGEPIIPNENTETAHIKGISLEKMFCEYMKSNLGYSKARTRVQVKSSFNSRGINVDVVVENVDGRNKRLWILSAIYLLLAVVLYVYTLYLYLSDINVPSAIWVLFALMLMMSLITIVLAGRYKTLNAWAECKNQIGVVTFAQMQKTVSELEAYKASGDKEFRFIEQYFASATEYSEPALKLAQEKEIICYILKNGNFEKVSYWS